MALNSMDDRYRLHGRGRVEVVISTWSCIIVYKFHLKIIIFELLWTQVGACIIDYRNGFYHIINSLELLSAT
jgi:hypothetical protein